MDSATLERKPVAKRKPAGDKEKRDDVAVKFDRILAEKAKTVAKRKGVSLAAYLSDGMRATIEKDFTKAVRELEGRD